VSSARTTKRVVHFATKTRGPCPSKGPPAVPRRGRSCTAWTVDRNGSRSGPIPLSRSRPRERSRSTSGTSSTSITATPLKRSPPKKPRWSIATASTRCGSRARARGDVKGNGFAVVVQLPGNCYEA